MKKTTQDQKLAAKVLELEQQLHQAQEKEKRSLADYQNLLRRTQEERLKSIKLANQTLLEELVQPLEHLEMAAGQLNDPGLNMVLGQLKKVLTEAGLAEIEVMGKEFDVNLMEVVEKQAEGNKVVKVVRKGYLLNGVVIQHAKVVLA
ncbi:MAG: nucleotide exchange factor GrpE [Candidatus Pacebacteria bacterium]|nr:nucleotide exchange factor GrpE [Candidatus Paceibacterota bacterium]